MRLPPSPCALRLGLCLLALLGAAGTASAQCNSQLLYLNGVFGPGYGGVIKSLVGYSEPTDILRLPLTTDNVARDMQVFFPYLVFNSALSAYNRGNRSLEFYDVRTLKHVQSIPNINCEILAEDPELYFGELLCLSSTGGHATGRLHRINPISGDTQVVGEFPQMTILGNTKFYHSKYKMFIQGLCDTSEPLRPQLWGLDARNGKASRVAMLNEFVGPALYHPFTDTVYTVLQGEKNAFSFASIDLHAGLVTTVQNFTGTWTQPGFAGVHSAVDNCENIYFTMIEVQSQPTLHSVTTIVEFTTSGKIVYERTFQPRTAPHGLFAYYPTYLMKPGAWNSTH